MTEKRSLIVYRQLHEAEQKFDYFITGLTGAICAYIGEGYTPSKIGFNASTVELLSVVLLLISFGLGFKRIRWVITGKRLNASNLDAFEKKGEWTANFRGEPLINASTGEVLHPEDIIDRVKKHGKDINDLEQPMATARRKAMSFYLWRNRFLFAGFLGLLAGKVLQAYVP